MGNYCIVADFYPSPFPMSKTLTLVGVVLTHIRGCRRSSQTNTITYTMTDTIRNIITDTLTDTCKRLNEVGKNTTLGGCKVVTCVVKSILHEHSCHLRLWLVLSALSIY